MLVPMSCIPVIKVVAPPSNATKAKTHMIEVDVHMQTHMTTTLPPISHNIYHQVRDSSILLFLMSYTTKIINVVAQRYATTKSKNKPARTTTDENGKPNSNIA